MKCKKCYEEKFVKAGIVRGKQRYKCKVCGCFFTDTPPPGYPKAFKLSAIKLYLEGLGFRAIGRILGISNVTIMNWVRNIAFEIESIRQRELNQKREIRVIELDEMWHYVGKKKGSYGFGWLLSEIQIGSLPLNSVVVVKRQAKNCGKK